MIKKFEKGGREYEIDIDKYFSKSNNKKYYNKYQHYETKDDHEAMDYWFRFNKK